MRWPFTLHSLVRHAVLPVSWTRWPCAATSCSLPPPAAYPGCTVPFPCLPAAAPQPPQSAPATCPALGAPGPVRPPRRDTPPLLPVCWFRLPRSHSCLAGSSRNPAGSTAAALRVPGAPEPAKHPMCGWRAEGPHWPAKSLWKLPPLVCADIVSNRGPLGC